MRSHAVVGHLYAATLRAYPANKASLHLGYGRRTMETPTAARHAAPQSVNTLIIGAGQAGLATSYWLSRAGVEHQLLDRR